MQEHFSLVESSIFQQGLPCLEQKRSMIGDGCVHTDGLRITGIASIYVIHRQLVTDPDQLFNDRLVTIVRTALLFQYRRTPNLITGPVQWTDPDEIRAKFQINITEFLVPLRSYLFNAF